MRFTSFKRFSLGLALVSVAAAGAASAQSLVGVNTRLDRTLDSKSAAAGQVVTAKLDGTVTADGTKLPKGTELIGKVADVKNASGSTSVSVVFTSAKLKDGKEIPVKATVLAAYPEGDPVGVTLGDVAQVAGDGVFEQQPGALDHVALSSAVRNHESGTFSSTNGSFKLLAGTNLQVGIAPASSGSGTNAAE
jgi:hypothetical protein